MVIFFSSSNHIIKLHFLFSAKSKGRKWDKKKMILKHAKRVCQRNVTLLQLACDDKSHKEEEQQAVKEGEETSGGGGGPSPHWGIDRWIKLSPNTRFSGLFRSRARVWRVSGAGSVRRCTGGPTSGCRRCCHQGGHSCLYRCCQHRRQFGCHRLSRGCCHSLFSFWSCFSVCCCLGRCQWCRWWPHSSSHCCGRRWSCCLAWSFLRW